MEKRRKIFDDGATVVEQVNTPSKKVETPIPSNIKARGSVKLIKTEDVIDTFSGYLPAKVNFALKNGGKCLICGADTSSELRKVCIPCLQKYGRTLYDRAKKAIEIGEKEFEI